MPLLSLYLRLFMTELAVLIKFGCLCITARGGFSLEGIEGEGDVPRAFTRRLAKEQTWRVWAQEWRDLEHGSGWTWERIRRICDFLLRWRTSKRLSGRGGRRGAIRCFSCCRDIAIWRGICTAGGSETGRSVTTVGEGRERTWSTICSTAHDGRHSGKS